MTVTRVAIKLDKLLCFFTVSAFAILQTVFALRAPVVAVLHLERKVSRRLSFTTCLTRLAVVCCFSLCTRVADVVFEAVLAAWILSLCPAPPGRTGRGSARKTGAASRD